MILHLIQFELHAMGPMGIPYTAFDKCMHCPVVTMLPWIRVVVVVVT